MRFNKHGKLHRPNGPAIEYVDGYWTWRLHSMTHRYYGPATSKYQWYIHGEYVKDEA